MNITDAGPDVGTFDYIICHGVFSWVPPEVQQKILALIAATLAPDGVAYVSYNTYPGWHLRDIVRDAMVFHIDGEADPREGIRKAREMLEFLVQFADETVGERFVVAAVSTDEVERTPLRVPGRQPARRPVVAPIPRKRGSRGCPGLRATASSGSWAAAAWERSTWRSTSRRASGWL